MERPVAQIRDHFATVGDLQLHYREVDGEGGPLLCLHGIGSNARAWDGLAGDLAPDYRVVAPDLRGRGESDKPDGPYGQDAHVADALRLMDCLGIERVVVLGWSLGGAVGVRLAALYPDRVDKLVLVDGGDSPPPERRRLWQPFVDRFARVYPSWDAFLEAMRAFDAYRPWTAAAESYLHGDAAVQSDGTVRHRMPPWVIERELASPAEPRLDRLHPQIRCPTLLLRAPLPLVAPGDETPWEQFEAMAARIPNARWREIPRTNHYTILIGQPAETTAAIREFLAE